MNDTRPTLIPGIIIASIDVALFLFILIFHSDLALKIISMIGGCHVGGRLAFIGVGFELGLSALTIIAIIILYNTAYLLLVYALFVTLSEKVSPLKFIKKLHDRVRHSKTLHSNWNLLSIAVFIWIPLPMTGAVIGALIAYLEGYTHNKILATALLSMYIGVISWTLAFDRMYQFMQSLNWYVTLVFTLLLLLTPVLYNLLRKHKS